MRCTPATGARPPGARIPPARTCMRGPVVRGCPSTTEFPRWPKPEQSRGHAARSVGHAGRWDPKPVDFTRENKQSYYGERRRMSLYCVCPKDEAQYMVVFALDNP